MSDKVVPRREPKQSRSKDTVEVLLDAAEKILRSDGPEALTTKRVAQVAGFGVGTLYQYFPSKEAIIIALERRMWSRTLDVLRDAVIAAQGKPIAELIGAVVAAAVEQLWPSTALHGWTLPDKMSTPIREEINDITRMAIEVVAAALQSYGDQIQPKNARLAASFAIHAVTNLVRVAVRDFPEDVRSGAVTPELVRMVTRYLTHVP